MLMDRGTKQGDPAGVPSDLLQDGDHVLSWHTYVDLRHWSQSESLREGVFKTLEPSLISDRLVTEQVLFEGENLRKPVVSILCFVGREQLSPRLEPVLLPEPHGWHCEPCAPTFSLDRCLPSDPEEALVLELK